MTFCQSTAAAQIATNASGLISLWVGEHGDHAVVIPHVLGDWAYKFIDTIQGFTLAHILLQPSPYVKSFFAKKS